jgi:hypothetical protein
MRKSDQKYKKGPGRIFKKNKKQAKNSKRLANV